MSTWLTSSIHLPQVILKTDDEWYAKYNIVTLTVMSYINLIKFLRIYLLSHYDVYIHLPSGVLYPVGNFPPQPHAAGAAAAGLPLLPPPNQFDIVPHQLCGSPSGCGGGVGVAFAEVEEGLVIVEKVDDGAVGVVATELVVERVLELLLLEDVETVDVVSW